MDATDSSPASETSPGIWSLIRSYLTPTTLFLLLNLVIGTIAITSRTRRQHHHETSNQNQNQNQHLNPALARNPSSALDRLRSFSLYRFRSGDFPPEYNQNQAANPGVSDVGATTHTHEEEHHFERSRSESEAMKENEKEKAAKGKEVVTKMKKSSSEPKLPEPVVRRAVAARPARVEEEHEVDARADDFINKFRQQLQLQRLNSLLNYKEMLNRGK